jgi:hypothetical protein
MGPTFYDSPVDRYGKEIGYTYYIDMENITSTIIKYKGFG